MLAARVAILAGLLALAGCLSIVPGIGGRPGTSGQGGAGSTGARNSSSAGAGNGSAGNGSTGGTTGGAAGGTSGGTTGGSACTYDSSTGMDSCTNQGYECSAEFSSATPAICVLPQDLGICDGDPNEAVGCQDGGIPNGMEGGTGDLFCSSGFQNSSGMVSLCLYSCESDSDCVILTQTCIGDLGGCFSNYCGYDPSSGAFTGPFFGTCPVLAADDGQCLSFDTGGLGICFPNGSAGVGQPCNPEYRFGEFSECTFGNYCVTTAGQDGGLCFPITVDGGCPAGDDAVSAQMDADWAVCATDCTTSMSCDAAPAGTTCQATAGGGSVCLP